MSQLLGKLSALLEQRLIRVTRLTELYLHLADHAHMVANALDPGFIEHGLPLV